MSFSNLEFSRHFWYFSLHSSIISNALRVLNWTEWTETWRKKTGNYSNSLRLIIHKLCGYPIPLIYIHIYIFWYFWIITLSQLAVPVYALLVFWSLYIFYVEYYNQSHKYGMSYSTQKKKTKIKINALNAGSSRHPRL